ncbi:MAG: ABC transporter permease [Acidobacteriia bacterium]|nr:ABC transporter permease [Terriglobia bacterium]
MTQFLHLFKKDLRRFWPLLVALLAILSVQTAFLFQDPLARNPEQIGGLLNRLPSQVLNPYLLNLILLVIVALLIHEEPLVGTSAFWLTRPISRGSLLASKGVFILLFLVVAPVAAEFVVLFHYGLESQRIGACLFQILINELAFLFMGACIAVLTPSLPIFAVAGVIGSILWALSFQLFTFVQRPSSGMEIFLSREILRMILTLLLGAFVVCHQYLSRRTGRSVVILALSLILIHPIYHLTSWDLVESFQSLTRPENSESRRIGLALRDKASNSGGNDWWVSDSDNSPGQQAIFGVLELSNVQPSSIVVLTRLKGKLAFDDGSQIPYARDREEYYGNVQEAVLQGLKIPGQTAATQLIELLKVEKGLFTEKGKESGNYSGEAHFRLYRYEAKGSLPLKEGAHFQRGSYLATVYRVALEPGQLSILLRGRSIGSSDEGPVYVINRNRRQVLESAKQFTGGGTGRQLLLEGGPALQYWETQLIYDLKGRNDLRRFPVDAEWLSGAEVVIPDRIETARFTRTFQVKDFQMADYVLEAWLHRHGFRGIQK